jgi:hypothetical protein
MLPRAALAAMVIATALGPASAQVIEFEHNGLKYQTLTHSGVTVMFAHLTAHVREYSIIQVSVSNGSAGPYTIRPEDFEFVRGEHGDHIVRASPARTVIDMLMQKGTGNDVLKLVSTYEASLYGMARMRSTNGYEQRRQAALAFVSSAKLKAAAAASAIALVQMKLAPGESTDGAVFFSSEGKQLGPGRVVVRTNWDTFEFNAE